MTFNNKLQRKDTIFLFIFVWINLLDMKRIIVCVLFLCAAVASISGQTRLRVVAYNVGVFSKYADDSMQDIANMMHELDADAVALCELDSCNRRHATFQLQDFAQMLSDEWSYRFGSAMQWNGGAYGTGLVTHASIMNSFEIKLPKGDGYEPRICVVSETSSYVLAAVHLDHSSEDVRVKQADLLTDELKTRYGKSRKPVFLCGDLNATPDSRTLRRLSEDWTVLSDPAPTYPSDNPRQCIDYILALNNRARYKVQKTAVLTEAASADVVKASDHLPVYVDVILK